MPVLFSLLALLVYANTCWSFDLMPNFRQGLEAQPPEFDYSVENETGHIANSATVRAPISNGSVFAKGTVVKVNNPPFLPYSGVGAPDELWDLQVGGNYFHLIEKERIVGASLTVGSASDYPFWSFSETTFNVTGTMMFPGDNPKSRYLILVNESNNRPFLNYIPIPGFIWFYTPDPDDHLILGLPFAGYTHRWTRVIGDQSLNFSIFYLVPASMKAQLVQDLTSWWKIFAAVDFRQEMYLLRDRPSTTTRLFYAEKRAYGGTSFIFGPTVLDFAAGYAFARSFFEAETYTDPLNGTANLNASVYLSAALTARF